MKDMTQVANWFGRKFDFSFLVELYPDLCMRLRGTPARLEEVVRGRAAERMVRAPQGKWSAQAHVGHLLNLESLWMARVEDYVAGRSELTVADLTNRPTFEARYNDRALEKILADFRKARLDMVNRLKELDAALFARVLPHPRMRVPMRLVDHLFFVAEHDDHHLAIIWEMIQG
ncbi:MAG: DinB family protein [Terriglobales bacterium]